MIYLCYNSAEHDPNNQQTNEDGCLRSGLITRDDRKYYLDLKENDRGRFLRVCFVYLIDFIVWISN